MNKVQTAIPEAYKWLGTWEGTFRYLDLENNVTESFFSRISYDFPDVGPDITQHVYWKYDDGRVVELDNHGRLEGDRLVFDMPTGVGEIWETDHECLMMWIKREDMGDNISYKELVTLSDDGNTRTRTIHWYKDGHFFQKTLIDETRVG